MNTINYHRNLQQGADLSITDGNSVIKVETGNRKESLEFWKEMKTIADKAVENLSKEPVKVHVMVFNSKTNSKVKSR